MVIGPNASLWCAHPRMKTGESFSSWLHRSAFANGMADHTYCRHLFGPRAVWNRDVDHLAGESMLSIAAMALMEDYGTLFSGTLRALEGILFDNIDHGGHFPWVLSLGVYHRTRRRHGQQFCALCLREGDAWLRLHWRLAWFVCCPQHHCLLRDACPRCDAPLVFHRMSLAVPGRLACHRCGANVLGGDFERPVSRRVLRFQQRMTRALGQRETRIGKERVDAHEYFKGLRVLVRGIYPKRHWTGLKDALPISSKQCAPPKPTMMIEHWRHPARTFAVDVLAQSLDCWPEGFVGKCMRAGIYRARFEPQGRQLHPHWLETALRRIERLPIHEPLESR